MSFSVGDPYNRAASNSMSSNAGSSSGSSSSSSTCTPFAAISSNNHGYDNDNNTTEKTDGQVVQYTELMFTRVQHQVCWLHKELEKAIQRNND